MVSWQKEFARQFDSFIPCRTQWFKGKYLNPNTYIQLPLQNAAEREIARSLASSESPSYLVRDSYRVGDLICPWQHQSLESRHACHCKAAACCCTAALTYTAV